MSYEICPRSHVNCARVNEDLKEQKSINTQFREAHVAPLSRDDRQRVEDVCYKAGGIPDSRGREGRPAIGFSPRPSALELRRF